MVLDSLLQALALAQVLALGVLTLGAPQLEEQELAVGVLTLGMLTLGAPQLEGQELALGVLTREMVILGIVILGIVI